MDAMSDASASSCITDRARSTTSVAVVAARPMGDERGTETVGLASGVPDEPAGLGQGHDHRVAGRLRNTQVPGDVGEAAGRLRFVSEEFRQHHDPVGLW